VKPFLDLQHGRITRTSRKPLPAPAIGTVVMALACICGSGPAHAQSGDLGSYQGTIKVSGTEIDPQVSYSASIKVSLPVTQRDDESINSEFYSGEAPDATVLISQWDIAHTEKSAGSDGKFASYSCKLSAPQEIPMSPTGVLNVDLEQNVHMLSLVLLGTVDIELDCVHSSSGAYVKKTGVGLYVGTGVPGQHYEHPLPISDAGHLAASYTLVPGDANGNLGPIVQEWDLRLAEKTQ
jgi:hypothetical protein